MITIEPIIKKVNKRLHSGEHLNYEATAGIIISGDLNDTFLSSENDWSIGRGTIIYMALSTGDLIKLEIIREITYIFLDKRSEYEVNGNICKIYGPVKWALCSNYDHDMEMGRTGQNDPLIIDRVDKNNEYLDLF